MKALRHTLLLLLFCCVLLPLPLWAQASHVPLPDAKAAPMRNAPARLALDNSTIQRIRNRGNLMIAGVLFDYQPFGYLNAQGEVAGFEVDLVRAMAEQWAIDVQFVPVTPSTRLQSLIAGQVDLVVAAMPQTTATEELLDFSQSYFTDTSALLARSGAPMVDLTNLAGKTIAAIQGDAGTASLQTLLTAAAVDATVMPFQEYAPALLALKAGQADAMLADSAYLTVVGGALTDRVLLPLPAVQSFGIGIAQGDAYFRNLVDATLVNLQASGGFTALYAKWFPDRQVPALAQLPGQWPYTFANSPSDLALPATPRLRQIQTRGKLLVGVAYDFAPFGFLDEMGQPRGFDIDLCREFARRWLGDAEAVELVRVTPATAIPLLMAGQVDLVVAALPLTWPNRTLIDFSQSYFLDGQSLLTRADSPIQELADLDQKVVAVIGGIDSADDLIGFVRAATTGAMTPTLLPFQELRSAQQALLAGQVDALIGSSVALSQTVQTNAGFKIAVADFARQPYAIGIPLFEAELRDQVNLTLQALQSDGVYAALYKHWFASTKNASMAETVSPLFDRNPTLRQTARPTLPPLVAVAPTATLLPTETRAQPSSVLQPTLMPTSFIAAATVVTPAVPARATPPAAPVLIATRAAQLLMDATTTNGNVSPPITTDDAVAPTITIRPGINANARRAPTTTAPIVEVLVGGTTWPILAYSPDGEWIAVQLPARVQAWVAIQLIVSQEAPVGTATVLPTVEPSPVAATATPAAAPLMHRVNAADTLATIAKQYYGNQGLWRVIYAANHELIGDDPNAIPVGAELVIPPQSP